MASVLKPNELPRKDTAITINKRAGVFSFFSGLLPLFVLAHFGHHVVTALIVPLMPFIRDNFNLDYTQAGMVISAFTLSNGISQLPAGWLADHVGPRILITVGISGVALAGLLVGLSQTYIMMVVFLALMGITAGGYHPSAPPLLSASVDIKSRGRALGFHVIGGSGAHFLAPLIGVAIASAWGWRSSFIGLAVPTIVFGLIFYVLLGRRIADSKVRQMTHTHHDETSSPQGSPGHLRRLIAFITLTTLVSSILFSSVAFIPLFMVDHFGVSQKVAGAFLAIIFSGGLWAAPVGGYLSDRFGSIPMILVLSFAAGPVIFLLNWVPFGLAFGALLVIFGMLNTMRMPVSESYITSHAPERYRSTVLGIYYFAALEGGGVLTPVVGSLIDRLGFETTFTIATVSLAVVSLICAPFLRGNRD